MAPVIYIYLDLSLSRCNARWLNFVTVCNILWPDLDRNFDVDPDLRIQRFVGCVSSRMREEDTNDDTDYDTDDRNR